MKLPCPGDTICTSLTINATKSATQHLFQLNRSLADLIRLHRFRDALQLFVRIHSSDHHPNPDHYTLSGAITATANLRDPVSGAQLHAHAICAGFRAYPHVRNPLLSLYARWGDLNAVKRAFADIHDPDVYSWTSLLSACAKLGPISYACHLLDEMPQRNVAAWNAVITGCAENGDADTAFGLFCKMQKMGAGHDSYSFSSVLSLCSLEVLDFGKQIHSSIIKTGFWIRVPVINALVTMYFNCRSAEDAWTVFEDVNDTQRDEITYNAMIAGLGSMGRDAESMMVYGAMQKAGLEPTERTFVSLMSSCSSARVAQQLHCQAIEMGFKDCTSVQNAAITMYSKFGDLHAAHSLFNRLENRDIVSWNTMITSYAQRNHYWLAISTYLEMRRIGIEPDEFTVGSLLAGADSLAFDEMIHAFVCKSGLIFNLQVSNALVSALSKHHEISHAYCIFCDMPTRNLISWNTLISGLQLNGYPCMALEHFSDLVISEFRPNAYTLSLVLSICSSVSALLHGKQVHGYILRNWYFKETSLGNALITIYSKCGNLDWSSRVFNGMAERDTISWNSLISAFAEHGKGKEAVSCFELLQRSFDVKPDQATFTAVLSACSRSGLVEDGLRIFSSMVDKYGFDPGADHVSCVVDLLSRAGYLKEAENLIISNHLKADADIWWALFTACVSHGDLRLGRIIARFLLQKEHHNPTVYVQLSNIYAAAEQWEEAANVRELMRENGAVKQPAYSWVR